MAGREAQVDHLVEAEGDPTTIAELSMQVEILKAIYTRATDLLERGNKDQGLRYGLRIQGYGDWTLDNVYAFAYDRPANLEPPTHRPSPAPITNSAYPLTLTS